MVFYSILYFFLGLILAAPYAWLSGGDVLDFVTAACFAPIVTLGLFLIYHVPPFRIVKGEVVRGRWNTSLWIVSIYVCLPIIFNGVSHAFNWMGYERAGEILFEIRYLTLWAFLLLVALLLLVIRFAASR